MRNTVLAIAAIACWAGGIERAEAAGGVHEHDGLYLNLEAGIGGLWTNVTATATGNDVKLSGGGGMLGVAVGGAITPNFVLAGRLWGTAAVNPDLTVNGQKGSTTDTSLGMGGLGLDLTYYFMPANVYLTATPSIGSLSVSEAGTSYKFDTGFAIRLAAGKEWWVSERWGIGLNVQYAHSSNKGKDLSGDWSTNWFGVAFSATYN